MKPCNKNIIKALQLTDRMLTLANEGDEQREDSDCGILYGIIRDSAYKIKKLAEEEKQKHMDKGLWEE